MLKKILLSIVAVFVILIVLTIIIIIVCKTNANKARPSNEIIMKSKNPNGKEALVIYQNFNTDFPKEISNSFATGLNNKGYNVTINTAGTFLPKDVSKYNVVILGGAVFVGNVGEPLQEYAKSIENFGDAKVILYSAGGSLDNTSELDTLEKLLSKKTIQKVKFAYSDKEGSKAQAISLGEKLASN